MIRVSENNQPLWAGEQQERPQLDENGLSTSVNKICNLPLELKRKIVSYLGYDDYANLRTVCKSFSQEFQGINDIMQTLNKEECGGEYKRELERLQLIPELRYRLQDKSLLNIRLALQNIEIRDATEGSRGLIVSTAYLPRHYPMGAIHNIPQAIEQCQKKLPPLAHRSTDLSVIMPPDTYHVCANSFIFLEERMDAATINNVFAAFNETYNAIEGDESVVIAALASTIKNALLDKLPAGLSKADITTITAPYNDMFFIGDTVTDNVAKIPPLPFQKK